MTQPFNYYVTIRKGGQEFTTGINGTEAAYELWNQACNFAKAVGAEHCDLWWGETGEVVVGLDDEDEDDNGFDEELFNDNAPIEWNDEELECGFNPYEGCYDWDC